MSGDTIPVDSATVWPADAEDIEEAVVSNWFVREGASVVEGDVIAEIQIEKVSVDVPAPTTGILTKIVTDEHGEFRRGDLLARIAPD